MVECRHGELKPRWPSGRAGSSPAPGTIDGTAPGLQDRPSWDLTVSGNTGSTHVASACHGRKAHVFRDDVNEALTRRPPGRVKGEGYAASGRTPRVVTGTRAVSAEPVRSGRRTGVLRETPLYLPRSVVASPKILLQQ